MLSHFDYNINIIVVKARKKGYGNSLTMKIPLRQNS